MYAINGKFNQTFRDFGIYRRLGIVSVTTTRFKESVMGPGPGDLFALYSTRQGWLGVGRVVEPAVPFRDFRMHQGGRLIDQDAYPFKEIQRINPHFGKEEYVLRVEWLAIVDTVEEGELIGGFDSDDPVIVLDDKTEAEVFRAFDLSI
ncbi:hypothetical protein [Salinicoccus bachuensis]|uniref:EVE domain-containing protein n=1 Tax=Salinicoccus bachuensis TaxID=3136731 RepID=A0ABZ3CLY3_9STAP